MAVSLFKIKGGKELRAKLEKLPLRIQNKILRKELKQSAKPVLATARAILDETAGPNTQYSTTGIAAATSPHPGYLKKLVRVYPAKRTRRSRGRLSVHIGTRPQPKELAYAQYKERGHKVGKLRKGIQKYSKEDKRQQVEAEPFLRPALERHAAQIVRELPARIARGIEQEAKKK